MLGGIISLASYGVVAGGTFGNILFYLEQNGVFAYLLPFLMIFAMVFGILNKVKIFGEDTRGINIVLSVSVALMALQLNFVSYFFEQIFPRMGIMLAIIFVVLLVVGMFWKTDNKGVKTFMGILMFIGVSVIVFQSFGDSFMLSGYGSSWAITYWLEENMGALIVGILLVGGVFATVLGGTKTKDKSAKEKLEAVIENIGAA